MATFSCFAGPKVILIYVYDTYGLLRAKHSRNPKNIRIPRIFLRKMATFSCFAGPKVILIYVYDTYGLLRAKHSRNPKNIRIPRIFLRKMATFSCFAGPKVIKMYVNIHFYDLLTLVSYYNILKLFLH